MPELADDDEDVVEVVSNHESVLRSLTGCDFVWKWLQLDPTMFGVPQTRGRLYYIAFSIEFWLTKLPRADPVKFALLNRDDCVKFLTDATMSIGEMVSGFVGKIEMKSVSSYMVPPGHQLYIEMEDASQEKLCKSTKPRTAALWVNQHVSMFKEAGVEFKHEIYDFGRYLDNRFYDVLPSRERSIISFFDETSPPETFDEVLNTTGSQPLRRHCCL
jgi:hypothetical protein